MTLHSYRKDKNIVAFTAARIFLLVAPTTVQTVVLELWIGNGTSQFWGDQDNSDSIIECAASEFTHFQSAIKQREGVRRLCIQWGHTPQQRLDLRLIERMDLFAQHQLSELDAKGILCFERI